MVFKLYIWVDAHTVGVNASAMDCEGRAFAAASSPRSEQLLCYTLSFGAGCGETRFPHTPPAGGFGRAQPSQEQPYVHPSVRDAAAWTALVRASGLRMP